MRRHTATLKETKVVAVVLDNVSADFTWWEKTLKQIAPIMFPTWDQLWCLWSDDIENVILVEDFDVEACYSRLAACCRGLTHFLHHGGQTDCPKIMNFTRPVG